MNEKIPDPCGSLTVKDQIKEEHKMPFEIDNMLEETPQTIKVVGGRRRRKRRKPHGRCRRAARRARLHEYRPSGTVPLAGQDPRADR